ncbi:MAG: threonine--tRNA ligase [Candidatus Ranarchaeia archaeon]
MKVLLIHSEGFKYKLIEPARGVTPEDVEVKEYQEKGKVLVAFVTVESKDEKNQDSIVDQAVSEILNLAKALGETKLVLYPWAHLSEDLASPNAAQQILKKIALSLSEKGSKIHKAAFGWYKSFQISCLGHSRAETLRSFGEEKEEDVEIEEHPESKFYVYTPEDDLIHINIVKKGNVSKLKTEKEFDLKKYQDLHSFIKYEMAKDRTETSEPPHISLMRRHELASTDISSDPGNLRWYPRGRLMRILIERYAYQKVSEFGALPIETPIMYSQEIPEVREQVRRFPARQYRVYSGKKELFLRYASDFGMFFMMSSVPMTYRNLPLRVYELTKYAFRREKAGETVGLRRLRAFTMPDLHTFCYDLDKAKEDFDKQYDLCLDSMNGFEVPFEAAFRTTKQFFNENRPWINKMIKKIGKPILLEIFDDRYFYWILKFEFNIVDAVKKAAALSTVQIDLETAKRYDINYVDNDGKKKHPIILHNSPTGAVERVIYAILENAARKQQKGLPAMFPLWLSPTQIRLIPISDSHVDFCKKLKEQIELSNIRCDIDDREETTRRKIRTAEREWVPYIVVIGDNEINSDVIQVRDRKQKSQVREIKMNDLIKEIKGQVSDFPFVKLPKPYQLLSKRPIFIEMQ